MGEIINRGMAVQIMRRHYSKLDIIFNIIRFTKKREFAALIPSEFANRDGFLNRRYMRCHNSQGFTWLIINYLKYYQERIPYNFYISNGVYKDGFPMFSKDNKVRSNEIKEFTKYYHHLIEGNDLFIDIDAPDHKQLKKAVTGCLKIMGFLDEFNMPYNVFFSGKGFHIIVPFNVFGEFELSNNPFNATLTSYAFYTAICDYLHDNFCEYVDSGINDSRRLRKVPFSLSLYKNGAYVVMPINTRKELEEFDLEKYTFEYWLDKPMIKYPVKDYNKNPYKKRVDDFLKKMGVDPYDYKEKIYT